MVFARVYVGAHYPAEVVVCLVFGAAVVWISWQLARPVLVPTVTAALRSSRLRPLLVDDANLGDAPEARPGLVAWIGPRSGTEPGTTTDTGHRGSRLSRNRPRG
jgi:hypothetical protein